jgi:DNA-binding protein Fis
MAGQDAADSQLAEIVDAILNDMQEQLDEMRRATLGEQIAAILESQLVATHTQRVLDACGGSTTLAAKLLGVDRRTIQRFLTSSQRPRLPPGRRFQAHGEEVKELRDQGLPWKEVAQRLGCSVPSAKHALENMLSGPPRRDVDGAAATRLRKAGNSWDATAGALKCTVREARLAWRREQLRMARQRQDQSRSGR